jgi:short-subunit dehydrogenase
MRVAGKVWVITGGGAGMGRQLVLEALRRGARVAAVDVSAERLQETVGLARADEHLSTHVVDITDRAATEALVDEVLAAHGVVDGLINNAGIIQPFVPVADLDYPTITRILDVNLMGTIHMVKAFLPSLLERPEAHLANVSSMGGFFPFPGQSMYGASKAGVKLLTEGLYLELADSPVSVSVILPGAVRTDITANSGVTTAADPESSRIPMTTAEDAARIIWRGIEKDRLHIYVGMDARLMNIAIKVAPERAARFVQRQMGKLMADPEDVDLRDTKADVTR